MVQEKTMKWLLWIVCLFSVLGCFSCRTSYYNLDTQIGLYRIVEKQCEFTDGLYNPCDDMRFVELVYGTFSGIAPDQIALVMWRAESPQATDGPLNYSAVEIWNHRQLPMKDNAVWLADRKVETQGHGQSFMETEEEFFIVEEGRLTGYHFLLLSKNKKTGKIFTRKIHYKLRKVNREEVKAYRLLYPEDL